MSLATAARLWWMSASELAEAIRSRQASSREVVTIHGMRMTFAANTLGLPAVALPGRRGDGPPQAVRLAGGRYREDLCLGAAAAIEDRLGTIIPIDPR